MLSLMGENTIKVEIVIFIINKYISFIGTSFHFYSF